MNELIVLRGIPGSGKSTFAKQWKDEDPARREVVNRDILRNHLYGRYSGLSDAEEQHVETVEWQLADLALREGKSVMVDDTNINQRVIDSWRNMAARHGVLFSVEEMTTDLETCLARNRVRGDSGGRFVPEDVIHRMHQKADFL